MDPRRQEVEPRRPFRPFKVVNGGAGRAVPPVSPAAPGPPHKDWDILLGSWPRKAVAVGLIVIVSGILLYHTWWIFLAAWITREKTMEVEVYQKATLYDPGNAGYHFVLAQIYNYSPADLNPDRAREHYEAAVRLNPDRSAHWLELSKFYEQEKNLERSRVAMTRALATDPGYAEAHWAAANLYVRLGEQKAADDELRRAAVLDPSYTAQVLDLVWNLYPDPERIMATYIPDTKAADQVALDYFLSHQSPAGAILAWDRLKAFPGKPEERFAYEEYLIAQNQPHQAWDVFAAGLPAVTGNALPGSNDDPPFFNAAFDTEPMNGGFDWRFYSTDDAEVRRDTMAAKDGIASLSVSFSGRQNLNYGDLWHWLPVDKGKSYLLRFWMKTDSISTNEGLYLNVDGKVSEKRSGTTQWQELSVPFTASADLVRVTLRRDASRKLDNLLKGKVWVDGFSISAIIGSLPK